MLYNLILEYCSGKTSADLIEDNHGELLESEVKVFARDVLSGLTYIHDRNIIHCDIKPDNLLLSPTHVRFRSTGYLTKIRDFGLAMEKGSVEYGNGYGHKRGTTRGEYGDLDSDDWVNLIGHSDRMPHVPVWLSKDALNFLSRCLERDVNKRWSTHSLKNHASLCSVMREEPMNDMFCVHSICLEHFCVLLVYDILRYWYSLLIVTSITTSVSHC
ncbi:hypothetical protein F2Q69_00007483 [Brassica cretica]|uniref:Protein kinase domain-containing protein n=1 Tax=Brassica cretica TaxID=69181 RepID=A0A8S9P1X2_BRACR|nr:hypothetical protein F2Q69_00007483 [Brassica cretica]